jgi:3-methyladenine DNA glycosylase AlkD
MGKLLQTTAKRKTGAATKKSANRVGTRTAATKRGGKPTLRQLNRLLTQNREQVLRKAKGNSLRLIGREAL